MKNIQFGHGYCEVAYDMMQQEMVVFSPENIDRVEQDYKIERYYQSRSGLSGALNIPRFPQLLFFAKQYYRYCDDPTYSDDDRNYPIVPVERNGLDENLPTILGAEITQTVPTYGVHDLDLLIRVCQPKNTPKYLFENEQAPNLEKFWEFGKLEFMDWYQIWEYVETVQRGATSIPIRDLEKNGIFLNSGTELIKLNIKVACEDGEYPAQREFRKTIWGFAVSAIKQILRKQQQKLEINRVIDKTNGFQSNYFPLGLESYEREGISFLVRKGRNGLPIDVCCKTNNEGKVIPIIDDWFFENRIDGHIAKPLRDLFEDQHHNEKYMVFATGCRLFVFDTKTGDLSENTIENPLEFWANPRKLVRQTVSKSFEKIVFEIGEVLLLELEKLNRAQLYKFAQSCMCFALQEEYLDWEILDKLVLDSVEICGAPMEKEMWWETCFMPRKAAVDFALETALLAAGVAQKSADNYIEGYNYMISELQFYLAEAKDIANFDIIDKFDQIGWWTK